MSDKPVVETVYGKYSKFEVVKDSGTFSTKFYVHKDGKPHRGSFSSLADAVRAAQEDARKQG